MSARPKLCANCGKLMGVGNECPYCGADNRKVAVRLKRLASGAGDGGMSVTATFIAINLFMFATAIVVGGGAGASHGLDVFVPDPEVLFRIGLQDNRAVDAGHWWRIITPIFLHMGLLHVAMNCYVLFLAGRLLEADFGGRLLVLIYLASGILGFVASYFADIGGAGASGATMGLCGAVIVRRRLVDGDFSHPTVRFVLFLTLLTAAFGLASDRVNNVAHGVGFVTGGGLAFALTRVKLSRMGAVVIMLATWGLTATTVVAAVLMTLSLFRGSPHDFREALACWQKVEKAVARDFDVPRAERGLACLGDTARLESEANDAREVATKALRRGLTAADEADAGAVELARSEVRSAVGQYAGWMEEAYPRYGLYLR